MNGHVAGARIAPEAWLYVRAAPTRAYDGLVLFDRDGTLTEDDPPYNGDPANVRLRPTAREAVAAVRARGLAVGVVSNQSGVGRGLLTRAQVESVADRIEELLGRFDVWVFCPHTPADGCACRKPAPGMVLAAADALGVPPSRTAVIGDIAADLGAAAAAGARSVLVPTAVTRPEEIRAAPTVAPDLSTAVTRLLSAPVTPPPNPPCPTASHGAVGPSETAAPDGGAASGEPFPQRVPAPREGVR